MSTFGGLNEWYGGGGERLNCPCAGDMSSILSPKQLLFFFKEMADVIIQIAEKMGGGVGLESNFSFNTWFQ